ncbi:hypothetical protein MRX96_043706 [Rhipicephalus microplus]
MRAPTHSLATLTREWSRLSLKHDNRRQQLRGVLSPRNEYRAAEVSFLRVPLRLFYVCRNGARLARRLRAVAPVPECARRRVSPTAVRKVFPGAPPVRLLRRESSQVFGR